MTRRRTLFVLGLAVLTGLSGSCGSEAPPPADVGPGDSLFRRLERLEVATFAASNVPADLRDAVRDVFVARSEIVRTEQWVELGDAPKHPGKRLWSARPRLRMDLDLGRSWVTYDGVPCRPHDRTARRDSTVTSVTGWRDSAGELIVGFHPGRGELLAAAAARPRELRFGWEPQDELDGHVLDALVAGAAVPDDCRSLARELTFDGVTLPALVTATPARLRARVTLRGVDELRLAVALWDVGFARRGPQVARVPSASDGVTFRVLADGERLWSRTVTAPDAFHEASVDLARFEGRDVELALETDPGPSGNADFDYAVWGGLSFHGAPQGRPARPHVVFVDIDTLRADRLGCYGAPRPTSPRLDRWAAAEAVLYEDAVSVASWTLPSTVSMLTGLAPAQHGVTGRNHSMGRGLASVAQLLHSAGYATLGRSDGGYVSASYGLARGFERFESRPGKSAAEIDADWRAALARVRDRRSAHPTFLFLQTYLVHAPYVLDRRFEDPERPYDGRFVQWTPRALRADEEPLDEADWRWLNDTYDAGVRQMDDVAGGLLEALPEVFGDEPYLVIVTSDHGEEIGDHGDIGHGPDLYEEVLRVPLLIRYPEGPRGVRRACPASGLDLVPTILDVVGLPLPSYLPGRSLRNELSGARLRVAEQAGNAYAAHLDGWKLLTGAMEGHRTPLPMLVELRTDPREEHDRSGDAPERARTLRAELDAYLSRHPPIGGGSVEAQPDDALVEELRALGYVE